MKKIIALLTSIVLVASLSISAMAATVTEKDLIAQLKNGVTIDGKTLNVDESYIKTAEDFFYANDFTDDQLSYLLEEGNKAKQVLVETGVADFSKIPAEVKANVSSMIVNAAKEVGVTITISKQQVKIVDANGKVFEVAKSSNPIKNTGNQFDGGFIAVIALISAVALVAFVSKKNHLFD
ncbi:MAG: hypothetical protein RR549_06165 [Oscillospiraceae bacterium]